MVGQLLMVGGTIFACMGAGHAILSIADVFRPTQFTPQDDTVRLHMKASRMRFFRGRANLWEAWLGFNISHGLGVFLFGGAVGWLGLNMDYVEVGRSALIVPAVVGFVYSLLSARFWFFAPAVGSAVATACFVTAWWSY